ncbi:MAG TPA: M28 family peptidase [Solirubrobacteraceae bacterium]|jgi:acetylornithine deacetylase/succinyl-diaminopimelate desuccinylase-like protein|nr:M28 family peptidase [Solirubrobacteraceae bacterium]
MSATAADTAFESTQPPWLADELHAVVDRLAAIERPSASDGERQAAEWIASRMREHGHTTRVEVERAHGGYWWPLGLLNGAAVLAGLAVRRRRDSRPVRLLAAAVGAGAAAAIWDDVGGGSLWFRRAALPQRDTFNVVAEAGDPDADETIVVVAHHDAAHSGLVFHPALPRLFAERFPAQHERAQQTVPIMYATWLGPVFVALGSLLGRAGLVRAGSMLAGCAAAAMLDIGASAVVPGANDNLSAVAVLVALSRALSERPSPGVRVLLLSTGSEESFMEGMQGFIRRHRGALDPDRTTVLCLECVGSPTLTLIEAEGMLRMRPYSDSARRRLADAAAALDVELVRGLRTVAATDALVALRRGYAAATLASIDETKFPANYHWPSDTPENLDWGTMQRAFAVTERFVRAAAG